MMIVDPYRFAVDARARLLVSSDDELLEPQFLLLSGDMTDGNDRVILSGDAQ